MSQNNQIPVIFSNNVQQIRSNINNFWYKMGKESAIFLYVTCKIWQNRLPAYAISMASIYKRQLLLWLFRHGSPWITWITDIGPHLLKIHNWGLVFEMQCKFVTKLLTMTLCETVIPICNFDGQALEMFSIHHCPWQQIVFQFGYDN